MKKKIIVLLVAVLLLSVPVYSDEIEAFDNQDFTVFINGERVFFNDDMGWPMLLKTNRTMVPIRIISEKIGYEVDWDKDKYEAIITEGNEEVIIEVKSSFARVNGNRIYIDYTGEGASKQPVEETRSYIKDSRTYVPLRFIAEAFGGDVSYRRIAEGRHEIIITTKDYVPPVVEGEVSFNPSTDVLPDGRMTVEKTREFLDYAIDQFKVTPSEFSFEAFEIPEGFRLGVSFTAMGQENYVGQGYKFSGDPILENQRIPVNESFTRALDPNIVRNANFVLVLTVVNESGQAASRYHVTYEPHNKEFPNRAEIDMTNIQGGYDKTKTWDKNRIFEGL